MLENYLLKGLIIGIVFGIPAGAVGILTIQRVLTHGTAAGLISGLGSSVADTLYAAIGVLGITLISDFLLKYQKSIRFVGGILIIFMGIKIFLKKQKPIILSKDPRQIASYFLSSFTITITNPATILSFMVIFSLFEIEETKKIGKSIQLVSGIFLGTEFWWILIAFLVNRFRSKITNEVYQKLNRLFGIFIILFGIITGFRIFQ